MSAKYPTKVERSIMLQHLRGDITFKAAAELMGITDTALAFRFVAYARYLVRKVVRPQ